MKILFKIISEYLSEKTSNQSILYQEQTRCARPSSFADHRIIDFGKITVGCLGDTARKTERVLRAWEDRIFAIMMCSIITTLILVMMIVCCVCRYSFTCSRSVAPSGPMYMNYTKLLTPNDIANIDRIDTIGQFLRHPRSIPPTPSVNSSDTIGQFHRHNRSFAPQHQDPCKPSQ